MDAHARKRTDSLMEDIRGLVDLDVLVDVYGVLAKHGVPDEMAADIVVAESMAMAVAEALDNQPMAARDPSLGLFHGMGVLEGATPVLLDHISARVKGC
ncbi:MAG: hypothetical protein LAT81_01740 [Oceanicaulis sp.]|nr:hypothetical protein [Oceanicaulis sp.]